MKLILTLGTILFTIMASVSLIAIALATCGLNQHINKWGAAAKLLVNLVLAVLCLWGLSKQLESD